MQRVQWYSHFLQNILKQDPTTAAALLHRVALSIDLGCALAGVPINMVKVLLIYDLRTRRQQNKVSGNHFAARGRFCNFLPSHTKFCDILSNSDKKTGHSEFRGGGGDRCSRSIDRSHDT